MIKQFLGIILSVTYALIIRVLAEWNLVEINSWSYLILTPMALGFIPFYFKGSRFRKNILIAILYPLLSVLLFLVIAVITTLEDLLCFIIIGLPYVLLSICSSVVLFYVTREKKEDGIKKSSLSVLLLPVLFGLIEKEFPKAKTDLTVSNSIVIDLPDTLIWKQLFDVPDLSAANKHGFLNRLGVPQPLKSTYDPRTNVRLGYFENGVVLNESVTEQISGHKLVFAIDIERSQLGSSPTLHHILLAENMKFWHIQYELQNLGGNKTLLKLSAEYQIFSNLPFYGKFWSTHIIADFEQNLLSSLKETLENR